MPFLVCDLKGYYTLPLYGHSFASMPLSGCLDQLPHYLVNYGCFWSIDTCFGPKLPYIQTPTATRKPRSIIAPNVHRFDPASLPRGSDFTLPPLPLFLCLLFLVVVVERPIVVTSGVLGGASVSSETLSAYLNKSSSWADVQYLPKA